LSASDKERAQGFTDRGVAEEWLAAQIALRLLLERAAGPQWRGVAFAHAEAGKPHLAGAPVSFSLSHALEVALIGIATEGSIGVDIERLRPVRMDAGRRARIEEAGGALVAAELPASGEARFLQAWVRLEAMAKAEGCGIGRVLSRLGIVASRKTQPLSGDAIASLVDGVVVRDLKLGTGVFAAAAFCGGAVTDVVSWLPTTRDGLQKLVG
jgi:4'-phosphopantetheinyl transferase